MNTVIKVFEVVLLFPQASDILDKYNIDYYCHGAMQFVEACKEKQLDPEAVWDEVLAANSSRGGLGERWQHLGPNFLSDMILRYYGDIYHKQFSIKGVLNQVIRDCNKTDLPRLLAISSCFNGLCELFGKHTKSEEEMLLKPLRANGQSQSAGLGSIDERLSEMEVEHNYLGDAINSLRCLTKNYSMQDLTSPMVPLACIMMQAFDKELTLRLHIENNILFPKIKKMSL